MDSITLGNLITMQINEPNKCLQEDTTTNISKGITLHLVATYRGDTLQPAHVVI